MNSGMRNVLILAGVAVAGYFVYRRVSSASASTATGASQQQRQELCIPVKRGVLQTQTGPASGDKRADRRYMLSTSSTPVGNLMRVTFRSSIDGCYTGRILRQGSKYYAEVRV
jgi:hypothetical protein